ncbi:MAG: hypothetical protein Q9157_008287 [Trypethelium eluteriae]
MSEGLPVPLLPQNERIRRWVLDTAAAQAADGSRRSTSPWPQHAPRTIISEAEYQLAQACSRNLEIDQYVIAQGCSKLLSSTDRDSFRDPTLDVGCLDGSRPSECPGAPVLDNRASPATISPVDSAMWPQCTIQSPDTKDLLSCGEQVCKDDFLNERRGHEDTMNINQALPETSEHSAIDPTRTLASPSRTNGNAARIGTQDTELEMQSPTAYSPSVYSRQTHETDDRDNGISVNCPYEALPERGQSGPMDTSIIPRIGDRMVGFHCARQQVMVGPFATTDLQRIVNSYFNDSGPAIPLVCLILVLIYFHRRLTKKQRLEDLNDKHGSLDFGLGEVGRTQKGKKGNNGKSMPEMTISETEKSLRRGRGMSMDLGNPYLMPGNLNGSRESIHSMSRSIRDQHDPYRPVNLLKETNEYSSYPNSVRLKPENGSIMTASSGGYGDTGSPVDAPHQNLLKNAQRMSRSHPPRSGSIPPVIESPQPPPAAASKDTHSYIAYTPPQSPRVAPPPQTDAVEQTESADTVGQAIDHAPTKTPSKMNSLASDAPSSSAKDSGYSSATTSMSEQKTRSPPYVDPSGEDYGASFTVTPPSPPRDDSRLTQEDIRRSRHSIDGALDLADEPAAALGMYFAEQGNRPISMGLRPLPPEDMLEDQDPEQRANRIRSFYKEYFDDSRPGPAAAPQHGGYYEDFGEEYLDGAVFDPASGQFVVSRTAPFAQPMGRRAMTPPPRGPPRAPRGPMSRGSANSDGRLGPRDVPPPKKRLPPPAPLTTLPTPHKLKEDSHIFSAIDFAPRTSFRDKQLGRPDSPLGVPRPYSPAVSAHSPLASSFDDLSAMPSPNAETSSDSGSIRSNRSGISAMQQNAIRQGAYRVSRIPKGMVTTKDDLAGQLKPTWDLRGPAHGLM